MVFFQNSIFDQIGVMVSFVQSRLRNRRTPSYSNSLKYVACDQPAMAAVDFVIMIAAIASSGYLLFPYVRFLTIGLVHVFGVVVGVLKEEFVREPVIYGSVAVCVFSGVMLAWLVLMCTSRKCRNPNCKGLKNATEFDIQVETEETLKNSNSAVGKDSVRKGLFDLPREYHRELEAELKKMAPPNGKAALIFKAKCGCPIGRLEVPGPRKQQRKIKK